MVVVVALVGGIVVEVKLYGCLLSENWLITVVLDSHMQVSKYGNEKYIKYRTK